MKKHAASCWDAACFLYLLGKKEMVDENELEKRLGLQDYWSYVTSTMGNGTGYINVNSGNLVYQKTDFANTAPLLASVMRRSFNAQAKSESGLGVGWDFGFNTNILKEFGTDAMGNRTTMAIILKDGDGTIHRFEKEGSGTGEEKYVSPEGVFITLEEDGGNFKATRSDDIVYTFNRSMMIESFEEPNGNKLLFEYIRKNLPYDQLIDESNFAWVHVSYRADGNNRMQVLKL